MSEPIRKDSDRNDTYESVGDDLERERRRHREEGGGMGREEVPKDGPSQGEYERPEAPPHPEDAEDPD